MNTLAMHVNPEPLAAFVAMMMAMAILFITVITSVVIYERVKEWKERKDG